MKATLEFSLPEEEHEHKYALSGTDALLALDEICNEIRSYLKYGCGYFKHWVDEEGKTHHGNEETLERVRSFIIEQKQLRNLPELV
jgi:hypothetical protein